MTWIGSFDQGQPVNCIHIQRKKIDGNLSPEITFFDYYFMQNDKIINVPLSNNEGNFSKKQINKRFKQIRVEHAKLKKLNKVALCEIGENCLIENFGYFVFDDISQYDGKTMPKFCIDDSLKKRFTYDFYFQHKYLM